MTSVTSAADDRRTILVTGANGFVGRHCLTALRAAFPAAHIIGTMRHAGSASACASEWITLDLLEAAAIDGVMAKVRPDVVLHLAAQAAVPSSFADPIGTWRINAVGTLALAEAVLQHAPQALFVQASSAEVYGLSFRSGRALSEDTALAPANPYAASKAAADIGLGEMALRGLRVIRMRPFNQVGPGQSEAFVVAAFARQVAMIEAGQQAPVIRTGALDRWRDMLDVRDVVAGYVAAIARGDGIAAGTAINLASGTPRRVGDILSDLISQAGIAVRIETDPGRLRAVDVERTQGDPARALAMLDWAPSIPWGQTLGDILADWRAKASRRRD